MRTALAAVALLMAATAPAAADGAAQPDGRALYDRFCLACHGSDGDGRGPAAPWLWPAPRDFTRGEYKWRSTQVGEAPTDADLARTIELGAGGTSMHPFGATLDDAEVAALVGVVKAFAPDAFAASASAPLTSRAVTPPAAADPARGEELYRAAGCAQCHGEAGKGDGPAAAALKDADGRPAPPYDLTAAPLRRPGSEADAVQSIHDTLATGLAGTPMGSFAGALSADELRDLAAWIDTIRFRGARSGAVPDEAIARDRDAPITAGTWPGAGDAVALALFGGTIAPQGEPPDALAPAQASLDAKQCARCHAKQEREWTTSVHAAAVSPGLEGQLLRLAARPSKVASCMRCHAPLAEQQPGAAAFDADVRAQGVTCGACHVRGWQRFGPPSIAPSLLALPGYPLTTAAVYERADFCLPCHQLPPRQALEGRPLLDTYREWLDSPYMRRGVQCQHCHMPNREHGFKGVHDPDTFRQGIDVEAIAARSAKTGAVSVRARLWNRGAGHMLPTTPTPAAWLEIELVDAVGRAIDGARDALRIGRALVYEGGAFREIEDTRVRPGGQIELARAWKDGRVAEATAVRVTVRVHPDDYYETLYQQRLARDLPAEARALFERALERAQGTHYVAYEATIELTP